MSLLGSFTSIQNSASSATKVVGNIAAKVAPSYGGSIQSATGAISGAIKDPLGAVDRVSGGLVTSGKDALVNGVKGLTNSLGSSVKSAASGLGLGLSADFDISGGIGKSLGELGLGDIGGMFSDSESTAAAPNMAAAYGVDTRLRLKAQRGQESQVYGPPGESSGNILSILHETNGFLFPYTPSIEWNQSVEYTPASLTHSNQDYHSYRNTPSTALTINGDLAIQNYRDARYMLAVIHFLRTASKMYFGEPSSNYPAGMPPPLLSLSGYGNYMFNELPVILKSHSFSLPKDVDYVDISIYGGVVRLPITLQVAVSLVVQTSPKKQREEFNLDKFRTGELMRSSTGWV